VSQEPKQKLVRFDFPPGATPEQIADALKKAYAEIKAKKNASPAPAEVEPTTPSEENSSTT
jgi:hypothetical protein